MSDRDTILTINVVEPALVRAVKLQSKRMGKELKGIALVHKDYANQPDRPRDDTGVFKEVVCDFNNPDELQATIKPFADHLLAATCRYEEAIQPFSQVIPFLPYIHTPSETTLIWSTEKSLMRDRLRSHDSSLVPRYQYMEANDMDQLDELTKDFDYPVIIKPTGLAKALLVKECNNYQELKEALGHAFKIIKQVYDREQYPGKPGILVEEMMQGQMYSIDAYAMPNSEILCLPPVKVTTAHSVGLPGFYGYEQSLPAGLSSDEEQNAYKAATEAVRALNLSSTTAHIEMFLTDNGWKIVELAARIGGFRDALYREAYGIEHFVNDLTVRMGEKPSMPGKLLKHAAAMNIYADEEGFVESIDGLEEVQSLDSLVSLEAKSDPHELALFSYNGGNPVVQVILSNQSAEQLEADVKKVRDLIKINIART